MNCSEREKIMEQEALLDYQSNPVPAHTIENVIREFCRQKKEKAGQDWWIRG